MYNLSFHLFLFEDTLHSSLEDSAHKIGECSNYDERREGGCVSQQNRAKITFQISQAAPK